MPTLSPYDTQNNLIIVYPHVSHIIHTLILTSLTWIALSTGWWNICIDLTFLLNFKDGISTFYKTITRHSQLDVIHTVSLTSLTRTDPLSTVPVITVPWPLIGKQWSTEYIKGPSGLRSGTKSESDKICTVNHPLKRCNNCFLACMSFSIPIALASPSVTLYQGHYYHQYTLSTSYKLPHLV